MRTIQLACLFLLAALALPRSAFAAESTSVRAILVIASNAEGRTDPQLAPYERALRDVTRYQSYRVAGGGSASVPAGGRGSIDLPGDNSVQLRSEGGSVQVMRGNRGIPVARGSPVIVLGGPANDKGDKYAIIVTVN